MESLEETIERLERCSYNDTFICSDCPYPEIAGDHCRQELMYAAAVLLKDFRDKERQ